MKKQKTGWKLLLVLTMLVMCVGCGAKLLKPVLLSCLLFLKLCRFIILL